MPEDEKYHELREIMMLDATGWIPVRMKNLRRGDLFFFKDNPNVRWKVLGTPVKNGPSWGVECMPEMKTPETVYET